MKKEVSHNKPFVSIIIPVKESSYYLLFETLPAIQNQSYKLFEVIVLPNVHSQYDLTLLNKYKWLKIIPTGKITRPAEKRNIGVKESKGELVAFIDDDAYPRENWLEEAVKLVKNNIYAVCGPGILPKHTEIWEKIFNQVFLTWVGSGEYSYRFTPQSERYIDDYPSVNFIVKKNVFLKLGGFKNDYWPGEDSKLCEDIVYKVKGKILYSPKVVVYHHRRKDLKSYLQQHGNYGFHRGAFFAHGDRNSRKVSYLIPTFFVLYLLFLLLSLVYLQLFSTNYYLLATFLFIPAIIYFFFSLNLFFLALLNTKNMFIAFGSVYVLFLTHFVYGLRFVKGFIKGLKNKKNIYT